MVEFGGDRGKLIFKFTSTVQKTLEYIEIPRFFGVFILLTVSAFGIPKALTVKWTQMRLCDLRFLLLKLLYFPSAKVQKALGSLAYINFAHLSTLFSNILYYARII